MHSIHEKVIAIFELRLGRVLNHDPRSREYPVAKADEVKTVLHEYTGPVMNQGKTNSCTGQTLIHFLNTDFGKNTRKALLSSPDNYFNEDHAMDVYSLATTFDEFPGQMPEQDTGSSALAVLKAGRQKGYLTQYRHAFGYDDFAKAIQLSPVMVGTLWYEGMFHPNSDGFVTIQGSDDAGGHEYLAIGLNLEEEYVTFLSSWGKEWGQNGTFKLPTSEFKELLSYQGDCAIPVLL